MERNSFVEKGIKKRNPDRKKESRSPPPKKTPFTGVGIPGSGHLIGILAAALPVSGLAPESADVARRLVLVFVFGTGVLGVGGVVGVVVFDVGVGGGGGGAGGGGRVARLGAQEGHHERLQFLVAVRADQAQFPRRDLVACARPHFNFTGFYRVLPRFTEFYWVFWVFTGFYQVIVGYTGY